MDAEAWPDAGCLLMLTHEGVRQRQGSRLPQDFSSSMLKDGVHRNEPWSLREEQTGGRWGSLIANRMFWREGRQAP